MSGLSFASDASDGCYEAPRAAALSGVPASTVYSWARKGIVVPSISPDREKLWSFSDLMVLRIVSWLRHPKKVDERALAASSMTRVRQALTAVENLGLETWWAAVGHATSPLVVSRSGEIYLRHEGVILDLDLQETLLPGDWLELTNAFAGGPDLRFPRPHLRIVPSKVSGEPHVEDSRVTTPALAALAARGYSTHEIAQMYGLKSIGVREGVDLELQLSGRVSAA